MKKLLARLVPLAAIALVAAYAGASAILANDESLPTDESDPVPIIEWDRDFEPLAVESGLVVRSCEGDGPFVCVTTDDGIALGHVEHLSYETDFTTIDELEEHLHDFLDSVVEGRRSCDPGYSVQVDATPVRTVAGGEGLQYTFTGIDTEGVVVERTRGYWALRNGQMHIVAASAYDDGGCIRNEGEFNVANLRAFEPSFAALVAMSPLRNLS